MERGRGMSLSAENGSYANGRDACRTVTSAAGCPIDAQQRLKEFVSPPDRMNEDKWLPLGG
jgi:hypothetical protein